MGPTVNQTGRRRSTSGRVWLAAILLAAPMAFAPARAQAQGGVQPDDLRCEYVTNPLGIDEPAPRLSWTLRSVQRGQIQTTYQILVASSESLLRQGRADVWDSGPVGSNQTTQVVYQGRPLVSGQRCFWKVRCWDRVGRPSAYSNMATWEMGLLRPSDWQAEWIGLPARPETLTLQGLQWVWFPEGNPVVSAPKGTRYFRRRLDLPADRTPTRARFAVAADDDFVLYANGREAGRGSGWAQAYLADVALRPGANLLALAVTNQMGPAGLLGRLQVEYASGPPLTLDIDSRWKVSDQERAGWRRLDFDDKAWATAREIAPLGAAPWGQVGVSGGAAPCPYLRRSFTLAKPVRRARIYATALGVYQLRLNGRAVSRDILAPGWTDYRKRVRYQTYDATELVKRGENALGAILGDGWFAGALGGNLQRNHFGGGPTRLKCQLNIEFADGSAQTVITDGNWRGATGPIRESDLYAGETYDARLEMPGWDAPGFPVTSQSPPPSSAWSPVTVLADRSPALDAQMDPPIRMVARLATRRVTEPQSGVFVFDLGQNMVGWARLNVRGPAGTQVVLRFGEVLNPDGTLYRANLRRARATDTYTLRGGGPEVFEPHFTYHGFRYVEVTGYPGRPEPEAITGIVSHSDLTRTSRFATSSALVNRLFQNIIWGQRGNLMSVPTDCPQRDERLGWMGDAQIFARTACFNMDMAAFFTKWMRDIVDAQSPEGAFSDVSPRVVDLADGAPAWAEAGIVIPWTVYQCYGDTRIIERNFPAMAIYVDLLQRSNPDLLWMRRRNNDFGDWVAAGGVTPKDLIASAYFAADARMLSEMAGAIGRAADAKRYGDLADGITAAFNAKHLSADGRYSGDSQTAYAMALGLGLAPAAQRGAVADRLVEAVRRAGDHLSTGFIGTKFLLPALSDTGHLSVAYQLLDNRDYPSWGYTIEKGATTIWELWNSDTAGPGMNSRNHFAFGSVGEWLQRYLAGIDTDPAAPGYRRLIIRPRPGGGLRFADTQYESIRGTITSSWTLGEADVALRVTVPANTTATVYVPKNGLRGIAVSESGRSLWRDGAFVAGVPGVNAGRDDGDAIVFEVGSGPYNFRLTGSVGQAVRMPVPTEPVRQTSGLSVPGSSVGQGSV
jgi:alpha-L-rhamnosidase